MWTEITRRKYEREGQRYASDLTDAEWALIEPHMPAAKRLGRPRETELRAVLDAILYIAALLLAGRAEPRHRRAGRRSQRTADAPSRRQPARPVHRVGPSGIEGAAPNIRGMR